MFLPGKFLFLAAIAAEVAVTLLVAQQIGVFWTLAWFTVAFVVGVLVVKRAGARAWDTVRGAARQPGQAVGDTPLLMAAGLLLILPGVLSDLAAVILLTPPGRAVVKGALVRMVSGRVTVVQGAVSRVRPQRPAAQAGELVDEDPGPQQGPGGPGGTELR
jgi:UPF0716 protein FxsA